MKIQHQLVEIGARLKRARKAAGLTQEQVASQVLTQQTNSMISRLEDGSRVLKLSLFLELCNIYGCSPIWALTGRNPDFDRAAFLRQYNHVPPPIREDLEQVADLLEMTQYADKGNDYE